MLTNWTIDGAQHKKDLNWWIRHKCPALINTNDPKYQQKSKSISSTEKNYLSLFAMRYPVIRDMVVWFQIDSIKAKPYTLQKIYFNVFPQNSLCGNMALWVSRVLKYPNGSLISNGVLLLALLALLFFQA